MPGLFHRDPHPQQRRRFVPISSPAGGVTTVALVVADKASLSAGDIVIRDRLVALGYTNTLVSDEDAAELTKDLVVICESVAGATIAAKYKNAAMPVVLFEGGIVDDMDFASVGAAGNAGQTQITILDDTHDLAAGQTGTVTYTASASMLTNGAASELGAGVENVAHLVGNANNISIYAYDTGAAMRNAHNAEARRVFVGLAGDATAAGLLDATGISFIDAAFLWAKPLNGAGGTEANAGAATGSGAANNATTSVASTAGQAVGTGAAHNAAASVKPSAGNAAGTGAAHTATTKVTPTSGVASGTGASLNAAASVKATAGHAAGTASAFDATVSTGSATNAPAGHAAGSGTSNNATTVVAPTSGLGGGAGAAHGATTKVSPVAGQASGTGAAFDATVTTGSAVSATATTAAGAGAAHNATTSLAATGGTAAGSGAALVGFVHLSPSAAVALASGAAFDATISLLPAVLIGGAGPGIGAAVHSTAAGSASSPVPGGTAADLVPVGAASHPKPE